MGGVTNEENEDSILFPDGHTTIGYYNFLLNSH